jgi:hypothetical protein
VGSRAGPWSCAWLAGALCATLASACGDEAMAPYYIRKDSDAGHDEAAGSRAPEPDAGDVQAAGSAAPDPDAGAPAAGSGEPVPPAGCDTGPELRVLFIGNSHTYVNDVPALVRELACQAGTQVVTQAATVGGASLTDHAANAATLAAIEADEWDWVILQDQQQMPGSRLRAVEAVHLPAVLALVEAVAAHRAQTRILFYMVWARRDGDAFSCEGYPLVCTYAGMTTAVAQGYRFYAERTRAAVSPVALAWAAVDADPGSPLPQDGLWDADGSHAALPGSYLSAAVLTGTLLGTPTLPLAFDGGLSPEVASYLRTVADRSVSDEADDPRVYTSERIDIACPYAADGCSDAADSKPVSLSISTAPCADLLDGSAEVVARIDSTLACLESWCMTAPLGDFHQVLGGAIPDATYQVHAHVDVDGDGALGTGDLEACETGFEVGSGTHLTLDALSVR